MAEYIDRVKLINDGISKGFCDWYAEIKYAQKEDVVERKKIDKAIEEIQKLRGCSCSCSDGIIDDVEDILDKLIESDK